MPAFHQASGLVHEITSVLQTEMSVGLYLIDKPEWLVMDHACTTYSIISVPLYDT
ncbi:hypothetical protein KSS87_000542, partial [Heliosperma pusillum]